MNSVYWLSLIGLSLETSLPEESGFVQKTPLTLFPLVEFIAANLKSGFAILLLSSLLPKKL